MESYEIQRKNATEAALQKCPPDIRSWLLKCASLDDDDYPTSLRDYRDEVEWFSVGRDYDFNYNLGIRLQDGAFIRKISGDGYDRCCRCWYYKSTLEIVEPDDILKLHWGDTTF